MTRDSRFTSHKPPSRGFTLVELSIVLVIIGLIVGAVVGGRSLIKAAELRGVISEVNGYKTAVNAFQLQYDYLPGDFPNASEYWTSCTSAYAGAYPCGGNGDNKITLTERLRIWQHLALAGAISGSYTGVYNLDGGDWLLPGTNSPESRLSGGVYTPLADPVDPYAFYIQLGKPLGTGNLGVILSAPEAVSLDTKMDDGLPASGGVVGKNGSGGAGGSCVDGTGTAYTPSQNTMECIMDFYIKGQRG